MTVGIALMLLPLLTDYPLQSKHLFLSRKMQLYAVRDICALQSSLKVSPTLADLHDVIGMEDTERKCRNSRRGPRINLVGTETSIERP